MYHSLQIIPDEVPIFETTGTPSTETKNMNGINTWDDWHLIPSSRPLFNAPPFKSNYIDLPGANGTIDVSTMFGGYPTYNDRTGSIEFYVMNDYGEWYHRYSDAMEYLHGKTMKVILEDEPSYYYTGNMTVNSWKSEKGHSKITFDYHVDPFKYEIRDSFEQWMWDPFSFIDGIIRTRYQVYNYTTGQPGDPVIEPLSDLTLSGSSRRIHVPIEAKSMPIMPVIIAKANSTVGEGNFLQVAKYKGTRKMAEYYITPSDQLTHDYSFYNIRFQNEDATLILVAAENTSYDVSVKFRGGRL